MHERYLEEIAKDVLAYCNHNAMPSILNRWSKEQLAFAIDSLLADRMSASEPKSLADKWAEYSNALQTKYASSHWKAPNGE